MDKRQVIKIVKRYKEAVTAKFGPVTVYLFGSYSKGNARADSDIDVAVIVPLPARIAQPSAGLFVYLPMSCLGRAHIAYMGHGSKMAFYGFDMNSAYVGHLFSRYLRLF